MNIRAASPAEAKALSRLAVEAKGKWDYSRSQLRAWEGDLAVSPASIERFPTFVAETGGEVSGFYQLATSSSPWAIEHFWVRPRLVRRGVGRKLLLHAAALAADAGVAELAIDSDPHAEPFYVACGARRVGVVPAPIDGSPHRVRPQLRLAIGAGEG